MYTSWDGLFKTLYVRKFSRLINFVVFTVGQDPRNHSFTNINEKKMAVDRIVYHFCS